MATIIRHESWIAETSTLAEHDAIDRARLEVASYQANDPNNYHAVDVYDLPRRGHWRVFSLLAVEALQIEEVINLCCTVNQHQIINADTTSGAYYCTPAGMLQYGSAELAQRAVNADERMANHDLLRGYILGDFGGLEGEELNLCIRAFAVVSAALGEASREVDYWMARITTTPLTTAVPLVIRDITCRIARYRLARYETGDKAESRVYRDYCLSIDMLRDIATGVTALPELGSKTEGAGAGRYAVIAPAARYNNCRFNREGWR